MKNFLKVLVLSCSTALAVIPVECIKGTDACMREDGYNPIYGYIAYDTGIVANWRKYGNFEKKFSNPSQNGETKRLYAEDIGLDPISKIVITLFPSNNDEFNFLIHNDSNFGSSISDPITMAFLQNYVYDLRHSNGNNKKNAQSLEKFTNQFYEDLSKTRPQGTFSKTNTKKNLNKLLSNIPEALDEEKLGFYAQYTLEQIISTFVWFKFDDKQDLKNYLYALDPQIVNHLAVQNLNVDDIYNKCDMDALLNIPSSDLTLEHRVLLSNQQFWSHHTPYKIGIDLLSNGACRMFNRKIPTLLSQNTFADCVETSLRHLMNLIFFDIEQNLFNLEPIEKISSIEHADHPSHSLIKFYKMQLPRDVNNGNITIRSTWNQVVADLDWQHNATLSFDNRLITYKKKHHDSHLLNSNQTIQNNNEIKSGWYNIYNVLRNLVNVSPISRNDDQQNFITNFTELLLKFNPNHHYELKFLHSIFDNDELYGNIKVLIKNLTDSPLYSFQMVSQNGHTYVDKLTIENDDAKYHFSDTKFLDGFASKYASINYIDDSLKALFLLGKNIEDLYMLKHKIQNNVLAYRYYCASANDTDNILKILMTLINLPHPTYLQYKNHFDQIIKHVFNNVLWDDDRALAHTSIMVVRFLKEGSFDHRFLNYVKGFKTDDGSDLTHYKNLLKLVVSNTFVGELNIPSNLGSLKELNIGHQVSNLINFNHLTSLENLKFGAKIKDIIFTPAHKNLTSLQNLEADYNYGSKMFLNQLSGIEHLAQLKEFYINYKLCTSPPKIDALNFTLNQQFLTFVKISNLVVNHLSGIEHLKNLRSIMLKDCQFNNDLIFSDKNESLTDVDITGFNAHNVIGIDSLPILKTLTLRNNPALNGLSFSSKNVTIEILELFNFKLMRFVNIASLNNLRELYVNCCPQVDKIDLSNLTKLTVFEAYDNAPNFTVYGPESLRTVVPNIIAIN